MFSVYFLNVKVCRLSILEAMACNRPVVASDVGGIHEVMAEKSGFLISPTMSKHCHSVF